MVLSSRLLFFWWYTTGRAVRGCDSRQRMICRGLLGKYQRLSVSIEVLMGEWRCLAWLSTTGRRSTLWLLWNDGVWSVVAGLFQKGLYPATYAFDSKNSRKEEMWDIDRLIGSTWFIWRAECVILFELCLEERWLAKVVASASLHWCWGKRSCLQGYLWEYSGMGRWVSASLLW